jgi:hypothetical protein
MLTQINGWAADSHRVGLAQDFRWTLQHRCARYVPIKRAGDELEALKREVSRYVSINEAGKLHTYRVVSVSHL